MSRRDAEDAEKAGLKGWLTWGVGILLGAVAISLGAPFWFDLIGRGRALRSAGGQPDGSAEAPPTTGTQPPGGTPLVNLLPSTVALTPATGAPSGPVLATPNSRRTGRSLASDAPAAAAAQTALPDFG